MTFTYKLLGNHTGPGIEGTPINVMSQNFMPEMRAAPTITGEQFGSETNAIWSSIEVTTKRACSFYKNGEICQQWNCDAEL